MTRRTKRNILIGIGIVVVILFILTGLIPTTFGTTGVPEAQARAGRVITNPAKITSRTPIIDIRATVRARHMSRAIARRLVRVGRPRLRTAVSGRASKIVSGNSTRGCAGTVSRTSRVYIFQVVTLAWRKAIQAGWCWDKNRITLVGGHYHEAWKSSGYCWSNQTWSNTAWAGYPGRVTEYRLVDAASLHITVPFMGCDHFPIADSFRYLREPIYYHRGGTYNFGR